MYRGPNIWEPKGRAKEKGRVFEILKWYMVFFDVFKKKSSTTFVKTEKEFVKENS